jgi:hypothetical protein
MRGKGPVYLKISGRTIKYRLSDLDAFLEQSVTQPGARQ